MRYYNWRGGPQDHQAQVVAVRGAVPHPLVRPSATVTEVSGTNDFLQSWKRRRIESLAASDREAFEELTAWFQAKGASEPGDWAFSEIREDIAQAARFLFLRGVWRNMQEASSQALEGEVGRKLVRDGADASQLRRLVQQALYSLAFGLVFLLDEPDGTSWTLTDGSFASDVSHDDRRWRLMEVCADGELTGRDVGGLHESLSDTDPSDREGKDWI
jgi:hypothetical protein